MWAKINTGESVAVLGVGGIGLSAVMAASAVGAEKIIAVDVFDQKLDLAEQIGATHKINSTSKNPLNEILEITHGKGVDYAIESAGRKDTMETALQSVRNGGGICIIAGNLPNGEKISIDPMDLIGGKNIMGTWGGETKPDEDIPKYVDLFLDGKLKLNKLITHVYKLEDINKAFGELESGKTGRALIDMSIK